jgi:hypothetical protein
MEKEKQSVPECSLQKSVSSGCLNSAEYDLGGEGDLYPPGSSSRYSLTIEKLSFLFEATSLEVALYLFNGIFVLAFFYMPHSNLFNNHHCLLGIGLALTAGLFRYSCILTR